MKYQEEQTNCEICGGSDFKHVRTKTGFGREKAIRDGDKIFNATDVMCMGCGLVKKYPALTQESLNLFYTNDYLALYAPSLILGIPKGEILIRAIDDIYFMEWLKQASISVAGKDILNVGSGLGVLSYFLRSYGGIVDSVEPLSRANEISKKLFGISPINCFFENISEEKKYDTIIFQNSLEHFYSPVEILKKAKRMLKPSGEIIVEIPDLFIPYPRSTVDAWLSSAHMYSYSSDVLWRLFYVSGLCVTHCGEGDKRKKLIRAVPGQTVEAFSVPEYDRLFDMFREMDAFNNQFNQYQKELLEGKDVTAIGSDIYNNTKYYTNVYAIMLTEVLLNSGKVGLAKRLIETCPYKPDASSDVGANLGSFFHLMSMIKRHEGDFVSFKRLNDMSIEYYLPVQNYNIVREMKMNGIISESILRPYYFWNALTTREHYQ